MEGDLAHADLRSDSAIIKKSMEGFFNATYAGLEGRGTRCRRQWRREPEPRKARKKMASLTFFLLSFTRPFGSLWDRIWEPTKTLLVSLRKKWQDVELAKEQYGRADKRSSIKKQVNLRKSDNFSIQKCKMCYNLSYPLKNSAKNSKNLRDSICVFF